MEGFHDVPLEEVAEFQSFVYTEWGNVKVDVKEVNEHVTMRHYLGVCSGCGDECLLGIIKMVDDEPANLYVPIEGPHSIDEDYDEV